MNDDTPRTSATDAAAEEAGGPADEFEEFELDDIEMIESKVFG